MKKSDNRYTEGRADAAAGRDSNPYKTPFWNDRPKAPDSAKRYDTWKEGHADKKREMNR